MLAAASAGGGLAGVVETTGTGTPSAGPTSATAEAARAAHPIVTTSSDTSSIPASVYELYFAILNVVKWTCYIHFHILVFSSNLLAIEAKSTLIFCLPDSSCSW